MSVSSVSILQVTHSYTENGGRQPSLWNALLSGVRGESKGGGHRLGQGDRGHYRPGVGWTQRVDGLLDISEDIFT